MKYERGILMASTALAIAAGSARGQEPLPNPSLSPIHLLGEDTAAFDFEGCDRIVARRAEKTLPDQQGEFFVSGGHTDLIKVTQGPGLITYLGVQGVSNARRGVVPLFEIQHSGNEAGEQVKLQEYFIDLKDHRLAYGGGAVVIKGNESAEGSVVLLTTVRKEAFEANLPQNEIVDNVCDAPAYELTFFQNVTNSNTGKPELIEVGRMPTEFGLLGKMQYNPITKQLVGISHNRRSGNSTTCDDGMSFVRYQVTEDNGQYAMQELLSVGLNLTPDAYADVSDVRVTSLNQVSYDSFIVANGTSKAIHINTQTGEQKILTLSGGSNIRAIVYDPSTDVYIVSGDTSVSSARVNGNVLEIIDKVITNATKPQTEIVGTGALAIVDRRIVVAPASVGFADFVEAEYDVNGRFIRRTFQIVCRKSDGDNPELSLPSFVTSTYQKESFNISPISTTTATFTDTPEPIITYTPTSSETVTASPTTTPRPTSTEYPEKTPTLPKNSATPSRTPRPDSTKTPPKPAVKPKNYIPIAVQSARNGRR